MKHKNASKVQTLLCYFSFLINGVIGVSTGIILNFISEKYGYSYNQIGIAVACQSFGNLLFCLISGLIIKKIGKKKVLLLFSALFVFSCGLITISKFYYIVCAILLISGIGWGLCNNIIHIIVVENNPNNYKSISFLHTSYALGSFIGPALFSIMQWCSIDWTTVMLIVSGLSVIVFVGFLKEYRNSDLTDSVDAPLKENIKINNKKKYSCCMLLYFGYIGIEVSINAWMVTYLTYSIHMQTQTAQLVLSGFWLSILIFRMLNTCLLKKCGSAKVLIILWASVAIITSLFTFTKSVIISCLLVLALSVFMAGISPTNAENAKEYISGSGMLSGILFAVGGLGGTILPIIIGQTSAAIGVQYIYVCIAAVSVIMLITAVINYKATISLTS